MSKIFHSKVLAKAVGRRKSAIAQVEFIPGNGEIVVNGKPSVLYLQENPNLIFSIQGPFDILQLQKNYNLIVKVTGGGLVGQTQAIKLAISRALCSIDNNYRQSLKTKGFLTRDSRCKERRKYGLKKARKASQFSKR
uniref:Small ribosomal subunit protein uS9c n=1 Tax=Koliella corcontica TaxID=155904 RepID=A0A097KMX3_9CHLO|nr:ribosomal protein S9 [Koliella corcontica]AIT94529.1 ribosomal protein S9 [Koliella corcontica]